MSSRLAGPWEQSLHSSRLCSFRVWGRKGHMPIFLFLNETFLFIAYCGGMCVFLLKRVELV